MEEELQPRLELVDTAVRFLENPKVQGTSEQNKRSFLAKKGLTEQEISLAFNRCKASNIQGALVPSQEYSTQPIQHYGLQDGFSHKLRDFMNILLLLGGFSYGARYLWEKYIRRWLYGEDDEPSPTHILLQTSQTLLHSLNKLQDGLNKIQETLEKLHLQERRSDSDSLEVKKEIQSVKGLLLSSRAFPQTPTLPSNPGIPSWQRVSKPKLSPQSKPSSPEPICKPLTPEPASKPATDESGSRTGLMMDTSPPREELKGASPPREELNDASPPREGLKGASPPREELNDASPSREGLKGASPPREGLKDALPPRGGLKDESPPRDRLQRISCDGSTRSSGNESSCASEIEILGHDSGEEGTGGTETELPEDAEIKDS